MRRLTGDMELTVSSHTVNSMSPCQSPHILSTPCRPVSLLTYCQLHVALSVSSHTVNSMSPCQSPHILSTPCRPVSLLTYCQLMSPCQSPHILSTPCRPVSLPTYCQLHVVCQSPHILSTPCRPVSLLTYCQLHVALSVSSHTVNSMSSCQSPHILSTPCCPVSLLTYSQSSTFQVSSTRVFPSCFWSSSRPFPGVSVFPHYVFASPHHMHIPVQSCLTVIFLEASVTLVVPRICSFLILYLRVTSS